MKWLILSIFILFSCKYSFTPYQVDMPKLLTNKIAMESIQRNEPNISADYKIAFISDTHNYYDQLAKLVRKINTNGPYAFVIVAGDITNEGLRDEYLKTKEILDGLNSPSIVVIGNHDLLGNGKKIYERLYGALDFTFVFRDLTFIFLNNNNWEAGGIVPDLKFVETSLITTSTTRKVLVMHVSPDDHDRFQSSEINSFENLVTTHGVDYVFNGHNHNPGESTFSSATKITIGAPTKGFYFELIISSGGLTHKKISF